MKQVIYLAFIVFFTGCSVDQLKMDQVFNNAKKVDQEDKSFEEIYEKKVTKKTLEPKIVNLKDLKEIIKDYEYKASDDDSKNSAREKALIQIKRLVSEELGTAIESSLEVKKYIKNDNMKKFVTQEISSLSTAITKLKVVDEKWNGKSYYVKAKVYVNEKDTMKLLLEAIKSKASEKDIKRLNKLLAEQNKDLDNSYGKINELQRKLVLQEIANQASIKENKETLKRLKKLKQELKKYNIEISENKKQEKIYKTKLEKMKSMIGDINNKAVYRLKKREEARNKEINKWKSQKKLICSLKKGVYKSEIENIFNVSLATPSIYLTNCEKFSDNSLLCEYKGRKYSGYSREEVKDNIIANISNKICSKVNQECINFSFNSLNELTKLKGCN